MEIWNKLKENGEAGESGPEEKEGTGRSRKEKPPRGYKKLRKDQFVVMALAGILLLIIAFPGKSAFGGSGTKKDASGAGTADVDRETDGGKPGETPDGGEDYAGQLERRLEETLRQMDGVGKVQVMITLESSRESVVEKDTPVSRSSALEEDSQGGSRTTSDSETGEETVYVASANGGSVPYVSKTIEPKIGGVVVVAQGGGSAGVRQNITEAVEALFGIQPHKIKVVKMKSE